MRSASHAHTMPATNTAEDRSAPPTRIRSHRRVMRAAWALHGDRGGAFAEALKAAWRHEKAQAALDAATALQGEIVNSSYRIAIEQHITSLITIDTQDNIPKDVRNLLSKTIERLIAVLDFNDGDPDDEPDADAEYDDRDLPKDISGFGTEHLPAVRSL